MPSPEVQAMIPKIQAYLARRSRLNGLTCSAPVRVAKNARTVILICCSLLIPRVVFLFWITEECIRI